MLSKFPSSFLTLAVAAAMVANALGQNVPNVNAASLVTNNAALRTAPIASSSMANNTMPQAVFGASFEVTVSTVASTAVSVVARQATGTVRVFLARMDRQC